MLTENQFKKFLIDEIIRSSKYSAQDAYYEVNDFSKTDKFILCFSKWKKLNKEKSINRYGPKHISEIFNNMLK